VKVARHVPAPPYGSRDYGARDPEGNTWYFGTYQPFAVVAGEEAASA
jgi:hypothetical protein